MQHVKLHILRILQFQKISIYHKKLDFAKSEVLGWYKTSHGFWHSFDIFPWCGDPSFVHLPGVFIPSRSIGKNHWIEPMVVYPVLVWLFPMSKACWNRIEVGLSLLRIFIFFQIPWLWHMFFPPKKLLEQTVNHSNHHKPWSPPLYWMIWLLCGNVPARPPQSPTAKTWVLVPRIVIFGHSMPEPTGAVPTNMKLIWLVLMQKCTVHDVFETFWRS